MKLSVKYWIPASLLALFGFGQAGCNSGGGSIMLPDTTNPITFTLNAQTKYQQNVLDTTGGTYGNDSINTASIDTLTQILLVKGTAAYQGVSNVNMAVATHSKAGVTNDTTYMYQKSTGDFYTYNFGVETLNNNPFVSLATGGQKFDIGWVLQVKMGASPGTGWIACDTGAQIKVLGNPMTLTIKDTATMMADLTLTVGAEQVTVKHAVHSVTVSASGGLIHATTSIDTYVSTKYGTVFNVIHSSQLQGARTDRVPGVRKIMISHS